MRSILFFISSIFLFARCVPANNRSAILISYDYNNGLNTDTLNLKMNKEIFSAIIDSIYNEQIECYSFYPVSKQFMKICEHPGPHINNAIAYLANSSNSKSKRVSLF